MALAMRKGIKQARITKYMFGAVERMEDAEMEKNQAKRFQMWLVFKINSIKYLVDIITQLQLVLMEWYSLGEEASSAN